MMTRVNAIYNKKPPNKALSIIAIGFIFLGFVILTLLYGSTQSSGALDISSNTNLASIAVVQSKENTIESIDDNAAAAAPVVSIVTGSVHKIPYYHCSAIAGATTPRSDTIQNNNVHVVLLHGAAFTKENWKTSEILDQLCNHVVVTPPQNGSSNNNHLVSVSAMDLPTRSAGHETLIEMLTAMKNEHLISATSRVALITPSASGKTVTDWLTNGDISTIPQYIYRWIPVAAGSVAAVTNEKWELFHTLIDNSKNQFSGVFAIYGNADKMGKKVTETLEIVVNAKTLEIKGGHPCYLDSPDHFAKAVLQDLNIIN